MKFIRSAKREGEAFAFSMSYDEFDANLAMPGGDDPSENATLTLTVNYSLNFAFPQSWTKSDQDQLHRLIRSCENLWNEKFVIITPQSFSAFDFTTRSGPGWICRPNVKCVLRLQQRGTPDHLPFRVFKAGDFPEGSAVKPEAAGNTFFHELEETLSAAGVDASLGSRKYLVLNNAANFGSIEQRVLLPSDAVVWKEVLARMTATASSDWQISMPATIAPRKMPVGFVVRGVMPTMW